MGRLPQQPLFYSDAFGLESSGFWFIGSMNEASPVLQHHFLSLDDVGCGSSVLWSSPDRVQERRVLFLQATSFLSGREGAGDALSSCTYKMVPE